MDTKFKFPEHLINMVPEIKEKPARREMVSLEGVPRSRVDPTKYTGNGHWQFPEDLGTKGETGFIYIIRDVNNNKLYLGKKNFRTKALVEGTTRRVTKDLNWRWYISSSTELSASVKAAGKQAFEFVAIEQYMSKGALSYAETWSLMHVESPVNRHIWYNLLVNKVSWVVKEKITDRHKERLNMMLRAVGAL
jgi:hypothetical protein